MRSSVLGIRLYTENVVELLKSTYPLWSIHISFSFVTLIDTLRQKKLTANNARATNKETRTKLKYINLAKLKTYIAFTLRIYTYHYYYS